MTARCRLNVGLTTTAATVVQQMPSTTHQADISTAAMRPVNVTGFGQCKRDFIPGLQNTEV